MSATNQPEDLDEPSKYAPKWIREEQAKLRTAEVRRLPTAPQLVVSDDDMQSAAARWQNDAPFEGDLAIKRMRIQRSLEPERLSEPEWTKPSGFPFGMLVRASVAIGVAILGALAYVGELQLPFMRAPQETAARETIGSDLRYPVPAETSRSAKMAGRVSDPRAAAPAAVPDPAPLRAEAAPKAPEPADAPRTVKPVTLAATTTAPWPTAPAQPAVPTAPVATAPAATAPAAPAAVAPVTRHLEPEEINTLIQRGEAFISQGDISAARLMLKRAAEAGNPRAALALGATYDPDMLKKMGVLGFAPDIAQARAWYERAAALGSGEATRRLAALR